MPTKRNRAGNQQPYIPEGNGDASGEYTNNENSTSSASSNVKGKRGIEYNYFESNTQKGTSQSNKLNDNDKAIINNAIHYAKNSNTGVKGAFEYLDKNHKNFLDYGKYGNYVAVRDYLRDNLWEQSNNIIKETGTPAEREKLSNMGIDSFFKTNIEDEVKRRKGQTWNWKETGYILTDGYQLDLSGKRDGAPSGQRSDDHRDIFENEDYMRANNEGNTKAMIKFMGRGNIRVIPEYPGINLQIEPTEEQYRKIYDMVARLGRDGFVVDFDNEKGDNVGSLNYDDSVSPDRVIADMKHYFKTGEIEAY